MDLASAHELIIRSLQGRATAAEEEALRRWRQLSPDNEASFREVERVWRITGRARERTPRRTPTVMGLLHDAKISGARSLAGTPPIARTSHPVRMLAAACVLLATGIAAGVVAGATWIKPGTAGFGVEEFVTGANQMASAQLGDGSVVRLAPHSRLRISGSRTKRDLWLDGRAFFAVAKDPERPFVVHTAAGEAVALGTRFELNTNNNALTLVMLQGKVALSANGATAEVRGGEVGTVTRGAAPTIVNMPNVYPMLRWVGEFLAFEATRLDDVGREISQRYGVTVRIDDPELADRTVTAWFTDESLQEVVAVVCRVVDARCTINGTTVDIQGPARAAGA